MQRQIRVLVASCVVVLVSVVGIARAQSDREPIGGGSNAPGDYDYFRQNCFGCHTIGGGRLTGPDLKNATKRKDREWLIAWVQNPKAVIDRGDPYAKKILEESRNVTMPLIPKMTQERAGKLLNLIEVESKLESSQFRGALRVGPRIPNFVKNPYAILNSEYLQKDLQLTKKQIDRIHQYNLQIEGVRGLSRNDVARELGFTALQKRMIADVYEAYEQKLRNYETSRATSKEAAKQEALELEQEYRSIDQKVMEVLTKSQQQQFERMKGTPFDSQKLFDTHTNRHGTRSFERANETPMTGSHLNKSYRRRFEGT